MAAPLTEPDRRTWAFALDLVAGDEDLLEVRADGTVWIRPAPDPAGDPEDLPALLARRHTVLELDLVRAAGHTHYAPRLADYALCGTALTRAWAAGRSVTCPYCSTVLPPEA